MAYYRPRKTAAQLTAEIAYYAAQLQRTTSADRIQRALVAIRIRERLLLEARRLAAAPLIRAHVEGCPKSLSIPVDRCACGGRDVTPLAAKGRR